MIKNFVEFLLFRKLFAREGFGYLVVLVGVLLVWDYQIQKKKSFPFINHKSSVDELISEYLQKELSIKV